MMESLNRCMFESDLTKTWWELNLTTTQDAEKCRTWRGLDTSSTWGA